MLVKFRPKLMAMQCRNAGRSASTMTAWVCEEFGKPLVRRQMPKPEIGPNGVLVKVEAASINPLDERMCAVGYGDELLSALGAFERQFRNLDPKSGFSHSAKDGFSGDHHSFTSAHSTHSGDFASQTFRSFQSFGNNIGTAFSSFTASSGPKPLNDSANRAEGFGNSRLPLIAGRDFAGRVVECGANVRHVQVGDRVCGVQRPSRPHGTHAEFVAADGDLTAKIPNEWKSLDATAPMYAAASAWSGFMMARLRPRHATDQRCLIHGASGGVGSAAVQMLKAWRCPHIVATCSANNLDYVRSLGAHEVIDYASPKARDSLIAAGPFDLALNCAAAHDSANSLLNEFTDSLLSPHRSAVHISMSSPLMSNTDRYGLPLGVAATGMELFRRNLENLRTGRLFLYGFFIPSDEAIRHIVELMSDGKLKSHIHKVYSFGDLPTAYADIANGHTRGKLVVDFGDLTAK